MSALARRSAAALLVPAVLAAAACQQAPPRTKPPAGVGSSLRCASGDAAEVNEQLGWEFCFPATWRALGGPKTQNTDAPRGVDTVYDITDFATGPTNGLFGVFIISTDEHGSATGLKDWITQNVGPAVQLQPAPWGNAQLAYQEIGGQFPRWFAWTPHHVVILEIHAGAGNLDLTGAMAPRLSTWKFTY